jgi:hypothetical protein
MTRGSLTELDRKQVFHPFTSIAALLSDHALWHLGARQAD